MSTIGAIKPGEKDRFASVKFLETRTGGGQLIRVWHPLDVSSEEVKANIQENIAEVTIPSTGKVIAKGGYGERTRFDVVQHKYAGGGNGSCGGYIEVLEIRNPPEDRAGFVLYHFTTHGDCFFVEWDNLENACGAFEVAFSTSGRKDRKDNFSKMNGFKRIVECGELTPWFYAIGNQELVGDYAFPEELQDDPVFSFGKKFVVFDKEGVPAIKTCMGCRFIKKERNWPYSDNPLCYRIIYWDDGSFFNEDAHGSCRSPRPLEEDEIWITEAIAQFRQLLAGRTTEFKIDFLDGSTFIGKLDKSKLKAHTVEGDYYLVVKIKGEKKLREGWLEDFKPTPKNPSVVAFVQNELKQAGYRPEYIEVKDRRVKGRAKKWSGVFFDK